MKLWNLFRLDTFACKPHLRRLTPPIPLHFLWNVKNLNKQKNLRYIHSLNRFVNQNCCSVFDFRRSVSALIVLPLVIKKKLKYKHYVHKKTPKKPKNKQENWNMALTFSAATLDPVPCITTQTATRVGSGGVGAFCPGVTFVVRSAAALIFVCKIRYILLTLILFMYVCRVKSFYPFILELNTFLN